MVKGLGDRRECVCSIKLGLNNLDLILVDKELVVGLLC